MATTGPYRNSSDLVLQVLSNLGILSVGESVDVEDFQKVNTQLDSLFRMLAGLEIVYVSDPNNIPGSWFFPLADIVAGELASQFGIVDPEYSTIKNKGLGGAGPVDIGAGDGAKALKIMGRGRPTYEPLRFLNY